MEGVGSRDSLLSDSTRGRGSKAFVFAGGTVGELKDGFVFLTVETGLLTESFSSKLIVIPSLGLGEDNYTT